MLALPHALFWQSITFQRAIIIMKTLLLIHIFTFATRNSRGVQMAFLSRSIIINPQRLGGVSRIMVVQFILACVICQFIYGDEHGNVCYFMESMCLCVCCRLKKKKREREREREKKTEPDLQKKPLYVCCTTLYLVCC